VDLFVIGMLVFLLCLVLFATGLLKRAQKKAAHLFQSLTGRQEEKGKKAAPERKDLATLEHHVRRLEHAGYSKATILKKLTALGWEEHLVELVAYAVHKPHNRLHALEKYVQQQLLKAKPKEIIKEDLLDMGWDEEIIDTALGLTPRHEGTMSRAVEKKETTGEIAMLFDFLG